MRVDEAKRLTTLSETVSKCGVVRVYELAVHLSSRSSLLHIDNQLPSGTLMIVVNQLVQIL